ncbi:MAG: metallophosphoesterase family protein [Actinobacteria bacterium]|nr:metallophosphoesterase family protein [Actinomycetota bacterium]
MGRLAAFVCACLVLLALPASGQAVEGFGPCQRANELPPGAPVNVELATVTDTEFIVTWLTCSAGAPIESDSSVTYAQVGGGGAGTATGPKTAFHYVRISDLEPGTTYSYSVGSGGITAPPDRLHPGTFTTLTPPPGKELFTVAAVADIHLGETVSGLATSTPTELPPSYRSDLPYPAKMLAGAVAGINSEDASLTLIPADNSSHGELHDLTEARHLLAGLDGDYMVARGAHDRPGQYEEAASACFPDADCFRQVFRPNVTATSEPQHLPEARSHRGWMFISLDSANLETGTGEISEGQMSWLKSRLEKAKKQDRPAVIFFHHPVAEYSSTLAVPPAVFGVNQEDAQGLLTLIGNYDVRLVLNSHTHRNWIAYSPHTGRMPILELGATKEYPGGYSLFRFYEGGFIRTWIPIECGFCNTWRETTRGEYLSLYPFYTSGSLRDRNFVHLFDSPNVPGIPSTPLGFWPPAIPGEA